MKTRHTQKTTKTLFGSLYAGDCFVKSGDRLFMKCFPVSSSSGGDKFNAIVLESGLFAVFRNEEEVTSCPNSVAISNLGEQP